MGICRKSTFYGVFEAADCCWEIHPGLRFLYPGLTLVDSPHLLFAVVFQQECHSRYGRIGLKCRDWHNITHVNVIVWESSREAEISKFTSGCEKNFKGLFRNNQYKLKTRFSIISFISCICLYELIAMAWRRTSVIPALTGVAAVLRKDLVVWFCAWSVCVWSLCVWVFYLFQSDNSSSS